MEVVTRISKPHIVDFLRQADKHRWVLPRIRYASIRSKPELCVDITKNFVFTLADGLITFVPRFKVEHFPYLQYDLHKRSYLIDSEHQDFPRLSRQKPKFSMSHQAVTLIFGKSWPLGSHGSGIVAAAVSMFP